MRDLAGKTHGADRRRGSPQLWLSVAIAVCGLYLLCMQNGFGGVERSDMVLLLCAVLLLSMSAAALGANNNYSSWFQTNYDEINKLGLMPASFNGLDLTKDITRGEMCELAVYAFEKATGNDIDMSNETFTGFTDTSDENIVKAHLYGIVNGYGDSLFGPNDPVTREQLAAILYRYAVYGGMTAVTLEENLGSFADTAQLSAYAIQAMNWAVGQGLINGSGSNLVPKAQATRAQVAAIIHRYLER